MGAGVDASLLIQADCRIIMCYEPGGSGKPFINTRQLKTIFQKPMTSEGVAMLTVS